MWSFRFSGHMATKHTIYELMVSWLNLDRDWNMHSPGLGLHRVSGRSNLTSSSKFQKVGPSQPFPDSDSTDRCRRADLGFTLYKTGAYDEVLKVKLHRSVLADGYGSRLGRLGEMAGQLFPVFFIWRWIHMTVEWMCSVSDLLRWEVRKSRACSEMDGGFPIITQTLRVSV